MWSSGRRFRPEWALAAPWDPSGRTAGPKGLSARRDRRGRHHLGGQLLGPGEILDVAGPQGDVEVLSWDGWPLTSLATHRRRASSWTAGAGVSARRDRRRPPPPRRSAAGPGEVLDVAGPQAPPWATSWATSRSWTGRAGPGRPLSPAVHRGRALPGRRPAPRGPGPGRRRENPHRRRTGWTGRRFPGGPCAIPHVGPVARRSGPPLWSSTSHFKGKWDTSAPGPQYLDGWRGGLGAARSARMSRSHLVESGTSLTLGAVRQRRTAPPHVDHLNEIPSIVQPGSCAAASPQG